ncbi:putative carboxylesterase type b [Diplodia seriata]|uniref:Carboxylic ester hydrolase n=1 Tax=Diplodia seriata TaxID=420778 RepID=A0A0G2E0V0_9PEZI|nr:putative carboxylesterase type b [Diplodia seriata]
MFGIPMPVFTSQLLLLIAPPALCQSSPSIVSTPQGIYHPNTSIPGVEQFLGIRYAEPPVGALRFAAPAPYASGDAAQHVDATRYGPACLQDAGFEAANGLSEDCLTLNIFRPAAASIAPNTSANYTTTTDDDDDDEEEPLLPVLVYIYGGANIGGQSRHYSAANLVLHSLGLLPPPPPPSPVPLNHTTTRAPPATPVLAITLNYRTGALGFLANTLFARRGLLNAGLKDQRLALQWVRDHVRAFGGDPARVTVFGQSAGAFDVWMQVSLYGLVPTGLATNETYLTQVIAKNLRTTNITLARPVLSTYHNHTASQNGRGHAADPTAPDSYYIGEAVLGDAVQDIPRRVNLGRHASGADALNRTTSVKRATANSSEETGARTWGYRWSQRPPLSTFDEKFYGFPPDVPTANKERAGKRVPDVPHWDNYNPLSAAIFNFEDQGPTTPSMVPDDMRLDSYPAYRHYLKFRYE